MSSEKSWETYEEVARQVLSDIGSHFGLKQVVGKQSIKGKSGTGWEIEIPAYLVNDEGFIIVECRRRSKSRLKQEEAGGLAYRIKDTGASGGIIVTTIGLQEGARKVAGHERINVVILDPDSTKENYIAEITGLIKQIFIKRSLEVKITPASEIEHYRNGKLID